MPKTYLIFFGPPGSGKGTQAEMLAEKVNLPIISPGALFRHEIELETELGKRIKPILEKGYLVDDYTVKEIILKRLKDSDVQKGVVFDGYPRRVKQQDFLVATLDKITKTEDQVYAILIDVNDGEVKRRLGGRRNCDCGATYHIIYNPPKRENICDLCGKKLSVRNDDKEGVIAERLKIYHQEIVPLFDYWEKHGKLIRIDGEHSIKKVHNDIINLLNKFGALLHP